MSSFPRNEESDTGFFTLAKNLCSGPEDSCHFATIADVVAIHEAMEETPELEISGGRIDAITRDGLNWETSDGTPIEIPDGWTVTGLEYFSGTRTLVVDFETRTLEVVAANARVDAVVITDPVTPPTTFL